MKNIDVVVKFFYPVAAGIETNIMETYSILVERGWSVTIHTSLDTLTEKNCLPKEETLRGITVKRYPYTWKGYSPDIDWKNTQAVCLHNFNILPHSYIMLQVFIWKLLGKKTFGLFLTPHGGFNPEWRIFPWWIAFVKRTFHFTIGVLLTNISVDGVRAVSEWENEQMANKGIRKSILRTISNGIEDEAYLDVEKEASQEIKDKVRLYGKYLVQVGRVYVIKNYETTLRAMVNLPKDLNYVIVGPLADREYKEFLDRLIVELGLNERVFFAGVVRGVDKFYLMKKAQMMVHMALWESFCNVVHEGMSQGLSCIVADNTALPLLIKNGRNGFCLPTKNSDILAEKIRYILDNKGQPVIEEIEERNREFGLRHSWRDVAIRMESFYQERIAQL